MPWNRIYYPAGSLSQEDEDVTGKGITDIYGENYPGSSVVRQFSLALNPAIPTAH
jgi:hypothetical protein